jgi:hypothetical protein
LRLGDESYDIVLTGETGTLLIPVKTRETMGGGHAGLFTRDIHKSITAAMQAGHNCLPIVIAESWGGDLKSLPCDNHIYIAVNPNQTDQINRALAAELLKMIDIFRNL